MYLLIIALAYVEDEVMEGVYMPQKIRQLKTELQKAGAFQISQRGSHTKWKHPLVPLVTLILSGHSNDDAKPYQEKIVRDLLQQIVSAKRRLNHE